MSQQEASQKLMTEELATSPEVVPPEVVPPEEIFEDTLTEQEYVPENKTELGEQLLNSDILTCVSEHLSYEDAKLYSLELCGNCTSKTNSVYERIVARELGYVNLDFASIAYKNNIKQRKATVYFFQKCIRLSRTECVKIMLSTFPDISNSRKVGAAIQNLIASCLSFDSVEATMKVLSSDKNCMIAFFSCVCNMMNRKTIDRLFKSVPKKKLLLEMCVLWLTRSQKKRVFDDDCQFRHTPDWKIVNFISDRSKYSDWFLLGYEIVKNHFEEKLKEYCHKAFLRACSSWGNKDLMLFVRNKEVMSMVPKNSDFYQEMMRKEHRLDKSTVKDLCSGIVGVFYPTTFYELNMWNKNLKLQSQHIPLPELTSLPVSFDMKKAKKAMKKFMLDGKKGKILKVLGVPENVVYNFTVTWEDDFGSKKTNYFSSISGSDLYGLCMKMQDGKKTVEYEKESFVHNFNKLEMSVSCYRYGLGYYLTRKEASNVMFDIHQSFNNTVSPVPLFVSDYIFLDEAYQTEACEKGDCSCQYCVRNDDTSSDSEEMENNMERVTNKIIKRIRLINRSIHINAVKGSDGVLKAKFLDQNKDNSRTRQHFSGGSKSVRPTFAPKKTPARFSSSYSSSYSDSSEEDTKISAKRGVYFSPADSDEEDTRITIKKRAPPVRKIPNVAIPRKKITYISSSEEEAVKKRANSSSTEEEVVRKKPAVARKKPVIVRKKSVSSSTEEEIIRKKLVPKKKPVAVPKRRINSSSSEEEVRRKPVAVPKRRINSSSSEEEVRRKPTITRKKPVSSSSEEEIIKKKLVAVPKKKVNSSSSEEEIIKKKLVAVPKKKVNSSSSEEEIIKKKPVAVPKKKARPSSSEEEVIKRHSRK